MSFIIILGSIVSIGSVISIILIFKWDFSLTKNYNLRCTNCKNVCDSVYLKTSSNIKTAIIYGLRARCPSCSEETIFEAEKVNKDHQIPK